MLKDNDDDGTGTLRRYNTYYWRHIVYDSLTGRRDYLKIHRKYQYTN